MSLETLPIDDLDWNDLTKSARDRIAGASSGQWTLHAPVDPGITLLELYASQLEQRLYWMDQPSDELTLAMLRLLGVKPNPVRSAKTVLSIHEFNAGDPALCQRIDRHSVIKLDSIEQPLWFRTLRRVNVLPFAMIGPLLRNTRARKRVTRRYDVTLKVGTLDVKDEDKLDLTADLVSGRTPPLLATAEKDAETLIRFDLQNDPSRCAKNQRNSKASVGTILQPSDRSGFTKLSFLLDLDTALRIRPHWEPVDDGNVPIPLLENIRWKLRRIDTGDAVQLPVLDVTDNTRGLRRAGTVVLNVPNEALASDTEAPTRALELRIIADTRQVAFAPRVKQVVPNVVVVEHRRRRNVDSSEIQDQIGNWKKLPNNRIRFRLDDEQLIPESARLWISESDPVTQNPLSFQRWQPVSTFVNQGPTDRVFKACRTTGQIVFGDGLNGRIPIPVESKGQRVCVCFDVGGDSRGNVAANLQWTSDSDVLDFHAFNPVAAVGGRDAETLEQAVRRGRAELRDPSRTVLRGDIEKLAVATPGAGIARAYAAVGSHPDYPTIPTPGATSVYVVSGLPESLRSQSSGSHDRLVAWVPDDRALRGVARWLDSKRLLTQELFVCRPIYDDIDVSIVVSGDQDDSRWLREHVEQRLATYLHPLDGGPDEDGWPFGDPLRPSELLRVIQSDSNLNTRIAEIGIRNRSSCDRDGARFESCEEVPIRAGALIALRNVFVRFATPSVPDGGFQ